MLTNMNSYSSQSSGSNCYADPRLGGSLAAGAQRPLGGPATGSSSQRSPGGRPSPSEGLGQANQGGSQAVTEGVDEGEQLNSAMLTDVSFASRLSVCGPRKKLKKLSSHVQMKLWPNPSCQDLVSGRQQSEELSALWRQMSEMKIWQSTAMEEAKVTRLEAKQREEDGTVPSLTHLEVKIIKHPTHLWKGGSTDLGSKRSRCPKFTRRPLATCRLWRKGWLRPAADAGSSRTTSRLPWRRGS